MSDKPKLCGCCGMLGVIELRFPEVEASNGTSENWQPYCEHAYQNFVSNAESVNHHEIKHFGGAYGLVTWEERTLIQIE